MTDKSSKSNKSSDGLREQIDGVIFRCFAQGIYWGSERDGKLDPEAKPEYPIDRTEALDVILQALKAQLLRDMPEPMNPETVYIGDSKMAEKMRGYNQALDEVQQVISRLGDKDD